MPTFLAQGNKAGLFKYKNSTELVFSLQGRDKKRLPRTDKMGADPAERDVCRSAQGCPSVCGRQMGTGTSTAAQFHP